MNHLNFVQALSPKYGGGLGQSALDLHSAFMQAGDGSKLVSTGNSTTVDIPNTHIFSRIGPTKLFFSYEMTCSLDLLFSGVDVVHGHGFYVYPNFLLGLAARKRRIPLVYHVHGLFEPWILRRSRLKKAFVNAVFEKRNMKYASLWRALTGAEYDQIRSYGIKAPIIVAPNGINIEEFDSVPRPPSTSERKRMVYLGRLHPKKGLRNLLFAWHKVTQSRDDWELVIAGPDELGHRGELESIVAEKCVKLVEFVGPLYGEEKVRFLKSGNLFVLPSYSEGFSVAILEGMACSLPIIATSQCHFPAIKENRFGWICEPEVKSVSKALEEALLCSEIDLLQMGKMARDYVSKEYSWGKIASYIQDEVGRMIYN